MSTLPVVIATASITAYRGAQTIAEIEASGIPAVAHRAHTDAIQHHVEPWAREKSSAPHMIYRHWADLIRSIVYGPASSKEAARHGGTDDFRALVYLESTAGRLIPEWIADARQIDPEKGYKLARKIAEPALRQALAEFRLARDVVETAMLDGLLT